MHSVAHLSPLLFSLLSIYCLLQTAALHVRRQWIDSPALFPALDASGWNNRRAACLYRPVSHHGQSTQETRCRTIICCGLASERDVKKATPEQWMATGIPEEQKIKPHVRFFRQKDSIWLGLRRKTLLKCGNSNVSELGGKSRFLHCAIVEYQ